MNRGELVFIGQYQHAVDDKNRLFIPAPFRAKSRGPDFILTQGLEGCLYLFPSASWKRLAQRISSLPVTNKADERAFKRVLFSSASEAEADGQGRIVIPKTLSEYAGIVRETTIVGVSDRVEIWARERWEDYHARARTIFNSMADSLPL